MKHERHSPSLPGDWKLPAQQGDRFGDCPTLRLGIVFFLFLVPAVVVAGRLAYLQLHLAPQYLTHLNRPRFRTEPLEAQRGRILAAAGTVLAEDETLVSLAVHYRWLEEPADEAWLTREARRRLNRADRRDRHRVDQEKLYVLAERDRLWQNLADETASDVKTLRQKAAEIQQKVELIADQVNARYQRRHKKTTETEPMVLAPGAPWWRRAGLMVLDALRAPPEPVELPILTIEEQDAYHAVIDSVSPAVIAEVEGGPERFPGVKVVLQTRRRYPMGTVAGPLLGYVGPVTQADLARQASGEHEPAQDPYEPTDRIGRQGLEQYYESWLRGRRGEVHEMVSAGGEVTELSRREPQPGGDVVVSLDLALQRHAEQLLEAIATGRNGAAAVVLDVHTGEVLAAASAPGFDPGAIGSEDPQAWEALSRHPGRPLFNRVAGANLPPGSVFKALSAIAFVQSGMVSPGGHFFCQGYLRRPDRLRCLIFTKYGSGHGPTSLVDAIKRSCNVFFFHNAERIGPSKLCHWAEALGFGMPTGIDLPGESGGYLPTPANIQQRQGHPWRRGDTPRLAIGQASLTVTPLQIARLMAAIANGGYLVTPHLVKAVTPTGMAGASPQDFSEPALPRKVEGISASKLRAVQRGLRAAVQERGGTGFRAVRLDAVEIAGKTGTAETGRGKQSHAWFAGYAPADNPRVAFVVVLEHGGSGGAKAGPVAKSLLEKMVELGYFSSPRQDDLALQRDN